MFCPWSSKNPDAFNLQLHDVSRLKPLIKLRSAVPESCSGSERITRQVGLVSGNIRDLVEELELHAA